MAGIQITLPTGAFVQVTDAPSHRGPGVTLVMGDRPSRAAVLLLSPAHARDLGMALINMAEELAEETEGETNG